MRVYRGMTGVSPEDLQRFVRGPVDPNGGGARVGRRVPASQHRWWSARLGLAMVYATTAGVAGPAGPGALDVVMVGDAPGARPDGAGGVIDRGGRDQLVTVSSVVWTPSRGGADERKARLIDLLDPSSAQSANPRAATSRSAWATSSESLGA